MRNDVSLVCTVMSVDPDCAPEITAMIGASIAISISQIPWDGPISGVVVGLVDGEYVINPTAEQEKRSDMHVTVASTADLVAMIEAGANEVDNDTMFNGIMAGHAANQQVVEFIRGIQAEIGKEKVPFTSNGSRSGDVRGGEGFRDREGARGAGYRRQAYPRRAAAPVYEEVHARFDEEYPEEIAKLDDCLYKLQKYVVRRWLLDDGKRVDGPRNR